MVSLLMPPGLGVFLEAQANKESSDSSVINDLNFIFNRIA
jgi:hypothetical protein